jgi:hypothetical protein
MDAVPEDTVSYVRELERRDQELAAALEAVARVQASVDAIGESAERLRAFDERLPRDRAAAARAVERAEGELAAGRRDLAEAERAAGERRRADPTLQAAVEHARAAVQRAEEDSDSARARAAELERSAQEAKKDVRAKEDEAVTVARELAVAPRLAAHAPEGPAGGLDGVLAWVARAQPALLLARSGLSAEREAVVREANELAAVVLSGELAPSSVAQIRDRVEQSQARSRHGD